MAQEKLFEKNWLLLNWDCDLHALVGLDILGDLLLRIVVDGVDVEAEDVLDYAVVLQELVGVEVAEHLEEGFLAVSGELEGFITLGLHLIPIALLRQAEKQLIDKLLGILLVRIVKPYSVFQLLQVSRLIHDLLCLHVLHGQRKLNRDRAFLVTPSIGAEFLLSEVVDEIL